MKKKGVRRIKIHHNKKILAAIFVLIVLLGLIYYFMPEEDIGELNFCTTNSDCVKQQVTCCPCSMGGKEVCMTKQNATYWKGKLAKECKEDIICAAVYYCQDNLECQCIDNKCTL